jgi:diguanylate cyclase (GGDEF)-like protein/PAS domain S-box-containing protein
MNAPLSDKPAISHQALLERVAELEDAIAALCRGDADALISSRGGISFRETPSPYQGFFEAMNEGGLTLDDDGLILDCNPRFSQMTGWLVEELRGRLFFDFLVPEQWDHIESLVSQQKQASCETSLLRRNGKLLPVHFSMRPLSLDSLTVTCLVLTDLSERFETEAALRNSERKFHSLYSSMTEGMALHELIFDASGKAIDYLLLDVNPAFESIIGLRRDSVLGRQATEVYGTDTAPYMDLFAKVATSGKAIRFETEFKPLSRSFRISAFSPARNQFATVFEDISAMLAHAEALDHAVHYDALTSLPNRRLLADRLEHALGRTRRGSKRLAVCYMDLDEFKPINERHGRNTGDRVLVDIARQLQSSLRSGDTLAHLGGDEFVLLFADLEHDQECIQALDRIRHAVSVPVVVDGKTFSLTASIGATLFPRDDADADTLLRHADQAMVRAKEDGKNRFHLFDPEYDRQIKERRQAQLELTTAFARNEFVLFYQPKVNLLTGAVVGAEALIRWQHPQRGLLAPAEFLGLMEGTELEIMVGEWVIDTTLRQIDFWNAAGLSLVVSANVSPKHLQLPNFAERLQEILVQHSTLAARQLELEILESAAIGDMERAIHTLSACVGMGVRFALDDFGTGYSSLTYFRRLPVSTLKIDQAFVRTMLINVEDMSIVESVVRLAGAFNRPVIAEGMETLAHWKTLLSMGCQFGQGYGVSRPMPAEQMLGWINEWDRRGDWKKITLPASHLPHRLSANADRTGYPPA